MDPGAAFGLLHLDLDEIAGGRHWSDRVVLAHVQPFALDLDSFAVDLLDSARDCDELLASRKFRTPDSGLYIGLLKEWVADDRRPCLAPTAPRIRCV